VDDELSGHEHVGRGDGTVTYASTTFSGSSETTVKIKGSRDTKISTKMSGKYLGACPK